MTGRVMVLNCGSSSVKYQLIDAESGERVAGGSVERIGEKVGTASHVRDGVEHTFQGRIDDHSAAFELMRRLFEDSRLELAQAGIIGVGHRVVHGGQVFSDPVLIDDEVLAKIDALSFLAPLHNPANVVGIARAREAFPDVGHVAVFDTAFFRDLPAAAATYALDSAVAKEHGIRRYGFHGTSHRYVSEQVAQFLGREDLNQIVLHLGNGASASAVAAGRAVDTSMGMTPLEGLVMGTRSGDIDPGVLFHLNRQAGLSVDELDNLLNRRSGMVGLSGVNDFRDIHARADAGDEAAELALAVYCHRVRKYVGAYLVALGGADVITFTAGVGENDARTRARILAGLGRLGIEIHEKLNASTSRQARVISTQGSSVTVMVVPTNEELAIVRETMKVLGETAGAEAT